MIPKDLLDKYQSIYHEACICAYRGSIAHGMYIQKKNPDAFDDKDVISIHIPDLEYYFGLKQFSSRGTQEIMVGEWDILVYELRKAVGLLKQGNPNILSLLWLRDVDYIKRTEVGKMLIDNRNLFVGKHVYHSFSGYAYAQFTKMKNKPDGAVLGYMGAKRKELALKYGYDVKYAAHMIRLLRMGCEFLKEGELHVFREDAQQLLEIKTGKWTFDQVSAEANSLFKRLQDNYDRSHLPNKPDSDKIDKLLVDMLGNKFVAGWKSG